MFDPKTLILIVDDMKTMRKIVKKSCTDLGYTNFIEAEDGEQAYEMLAGSTSPVGLIISDWNMPKVTGLDFLKRVRGDEKFKAMPFLLLTAESEASQVTTAVHAGVDNYLVKPFTTQALSDKLSAVFKKRKGATAA
jgi:two-component system chemotaxis response regulator CheY